MAHSFVLLNVFAIPGRPFSGNPLCVFENGAEFSDARMQAIARQFNLSETTFVLPPTTAATARVRIFTPTFEMPFAGHPTLGTAHVVRSLREPRPDHVALEMKAGLVEVAAKGDEWTLKTATGPTTRAPEAGRDALAAMLGLPADALADHPGWVDTGAEQLILPLRSAEAVRAAKPVAALMERDGFSAKRGASMAYCWARTSDDEVVARFFFVSGGGVVEDPATGSACANLGGWMATNGQSLPLRVRIHQGEAIARPSLLTLHVDAEKRIYVTGLVEEIGRGTITMPASP